MRRSAYEDRDGVESFGCGFVYDDGGAARLEGVGCAGYNYLSWEWGNFNVGFSGWYPGRPPFLRLSGGLHIKMGRLIEFIGAQLQFDGV